MSDQPLKAGALFAGIGGFCIGFEKAGIATSVSMGAAIQEAECSICHNIAHNVNELCLVPETQITMADGTTKAIRDIILGDNVVTASGVSRLVTNIYKRKIEI